ncbi:MAG TPA: hypothetical protein VHE35_13535 [Kofleriaceae bacterium]|nr:hypothetical protein [Kofleriaceae bacterium]
MSRWKLFDAEPVPGMRGAASLTEPDDEVAGVVDIAVIGARGDGKTQFILHAIRTLDARACPELMDEERAQSQRIKTVAMNADAPSPDATPPGFIPHYAYRAHPGPVLEQLETGAWLTLLARTARLRVHLAIAIVAAAALAVGGAALGYPLGFSVAGGIVAFGVLGGLGLWLSRRRLIQAGEIEVVFWDVAGEHVSKDGGDYHSFLDEVATRRRGVGGRRYAFAPVLLCNPLSLGVHRDGSTYTKLRKMLPLFASINRGSGRAAAANRTRAMVVINRASVIDELCQDGDRDEQVEVITRSRRRGEEVEVRRDLVQRGVVQHHCVDVEDGTVDGVEIDYLRYDAGDQCRSTPRRPGTGEPAGPAGVDYVYTDDVAPFQDQARSAFLAWLAELAYGAPAPAPAPVEEVVALTRRAPPAVELPPSATGGFGTGGN